MPPKMWILLILLSISSRTICNLAILTVGVLYPAYNCCQAISDKNNYEYVRWMMYWVSLSVFATLEPLADIVFANCITCYAPLKLAFVLWLQSSSAKGAKHVYRKVILPSFLRHEAVVDRCLAALKCYAVAVFSFAGRTMKRLIIRGIMTQVSKDSTLREHIPSDLVLSMDGTDVPANEDTGAELSSAPGDHIRRNMSPLRSRNTMANNTNTLVP
ncbi:receptor expression-enhancing protein 4-like [Ornithodoros turicata]|uniref:receptor expression-enhancing protein 4-like n=1 Tax=Ornithodoros turicata TaxID=34597 RepID=UPI003138C0C0